MVQSFVGAGNFAAYAAATVGSTGRKPASASSFWRLGRVEEVVERRRLGEVLAALEHGRGVLDLEGRRRRDVLDGVAVLLDEEGLVLVAEEHVAAALQERLGRLTPRLRLDLHVLA